MNGKNNRTLLLVHVNVLVGRLTRRRMPLGLQLLAAAARQAGWEVLGRYWGSELTARKFEEDLNQTQPALVGFYTDLLNVYTLGRLLRYCSPKIRPLTILGGPEASFNYRRVMERVPADLLVRGDGEPVIPELLQGDCRDPNFLRRVPGISFRHNGVVHHNPDRPYSSQESYPFPERQLLPGESESLHIITARGCPHRCAFCSEATLPYRPRKVEHVTMELEAAFQKGKPRWIVIMDDTFTADVRRTRKITRFLQEAYGGRWSCEVTAEEICRHPGVAREMAEAGLTRVQMGIESGNNETLRVYQKNLTREKLEEAIDILLKAGVKVVYGNFIVGAPGETSEMVQRNMEFAGDLIRRYPGQLELSVSVLTFNAGAPFFEEPEKYGLTFSEQTREGALEFRSSACATSTLTTMEIQQLHDEFWRRNSQAVEGVLKDLTPGQVRDQLYFNEMGFSTIWNKRLLAIQHIAKHYQYVKYEGSHLDITDIPFSEMEKAIPQRTRLEVQLATDGNVVLSGLSGEIKHLNATASFLDEVACGQHTIREIALLLYDRLPHFHRPPFEMVLSDTIKFYAKLAQELYIAFLAP